MENETSKGEVLSPEQTKAKAAILAECDKLAAAGVAMVFVHFDGYGDEGAAEGVKCYQSETYAYPDGEAVECEASYLQEHFEVLIPFGYEDGCGGFGDVVLNVKARKITVERNDRFEDYTTTTYEV